MLFEIHIDVSLLLLCACVLFAAWRIRKAIRDREDEDLDELEELELEEERELAVDLKVVVRRGISAPEARE
jgi:hypothetical protein